MSNEIPEPPEGCANLKLSAVYFREEPVNSTLCIELTTVVSKGWGRQMLTKHADMKAKQHCWGKLAKEGWGLQTVVIADDQDWEIPEE